MSDHTSLVVIEQKQVTFMGDELIAVSATSKEGVEKQIYIPIRPICDFLGIDAASQRKRIGRDEVLSKVAVNINIALPGDQTRSMFCLPLEFISGFLFGIQIRRVKEEYRPKLLTYKERCYQVLHEAFQEGRLTYDNELDLLMDNDSPAAQALHMAQAIVKLARHQLLMEQQIRSHEQQITHHEQRLELIESQLGDESRTISKSQAMQISQAVKAIGLVWSKKEKKNQYGAVYGRFYEQFEITSYKMLPASQFEEAMTFLTTWHQELVSDIPF